MDVIKNLDFQNILQIVEILAGAWILIVLFQKFIPKLANKFSGKPRYYTLATVPMLRLILILAAGGLIIVRIIEPTFENLVALLGAIGIALGFAFKDYASSLIAGIVSLYEMPYRLGDWVTVDDTYGEVTNIGMRAIEIITPDDTTVVVPHAKIWNQLVHNANNGTQNLMCVADFYLRSDRDPGQSRSILRNVGLTSVYTNVQMPVIVVAEEHPWGTQFRLKAYPVDPKDQFQLRTDLILRGKDALRQEGYEFVQVNAVPQKPV